jgi:hypothetical protein
MIRVEQTSALIPKNENLKNLKYVHFFYLAMSGAHFCVLILFLVFLSLSSDASKKTPFSKQKKIKKIGIFSLTNETKITI